MPARAQNSSGGKAPRDTSADHAARRRVDGEQDEADASARTPSPARAPSPKRVKGDGANRVNRDARSLREQGANRADDEEEDEEEDEEKKGDDLFWRHLAQGAYRSRKRREEEGAG
jgi:hypothetical protein